MHRAHAHSSVYALSWKSINLNYEGHRLAGDNDALDDSVLIRKHKYDMRRDMRFVLNRTVSGLKHIVSLHSN